MKDGGGSEEKHRNFFGTGCVIDNSKASANFFAGAHQSAWGGNVSSRHSVSQSFSQRVYETEIE